MKINPRDLESIQHYPNREFDRLENREDEDEEERYPVGRLYD